MAAEMQYKRRKIDYTTIRRELKEALLYIAKLKLHPSDVIINKFMKLINKEIFSSKPFQKAHSYEFINAAKKGDYQRV